MISAVFFDLGNTLIYFDSTWEQVMQEANGELVRSLRSAGYDVDAEAFPAAFEERINSYYTRQDTEFMEYTTEYVLRSLLTEAGFTDTPTERLKPVIAAMHAITQAHWHAEADAHPTLETLRSHGYRLGLISNAGDALDVQALVDRAGLRRYFEQILISAEVGRRKPHPQIFQLGLAHFGVPPERAAMIGDTLGADILGANLIGMVSVWITRRANRPDNQSHEDTIQPAAVVGSLAELPPLLSRF